MTVFYKHNTLSTKKALSSTTYNLSIYDSIYLGYDGQTINLPEPSTCRGQNFTIKLPSSYTTGITIDAGASYLIDGNRYYQIKTSYGFVELVSNSDSWSVINSSYNYTPNFSNNTYSLSLTDNQATSLDIKEGSTSYLKFDTTNGSEKVVIGKTIEGTTATQSALDNSTKLASTAYVQTATRVPTATKTANYTLALADEGYMIIMNSASATTLTVPIESSVNFPLGSQIIVTRLGAGTVNIASSATIYSVSSNKYIANQYGAVTLIKTGTDTWYLFGDLSAS
jgi:hypothetical protein